MLKPVSDKKSNATDKNALTGTPSVNDTENTSASSLADAPRFVAPTHGGVDILKLLSELEEVVERSKRLPGGLIFRFDEDKFHMTIMKIRANLPEEMKRASKLMRDSERLVEESREQAGSLVEEAKKSALTEVERAKIEASRLKQNLEKEALTVRERAEGEAMGVKEKARAEADGILAQARERASLLVSDSEIVQRAQIEAVEIRRHAEQEAIRLQQGADEYAREALGNLEGILNKAITVVQRGREVLEKPTPKR